jgi:hypothetical protein
MMPTWQNNGCMPSGWVRGNVRKWIHEDDELRGLALWYLGKAREVGLPRKEAAKWMLEELHRLGITHTPEGATYGIQNIWKGMAGL